MKSIEEIQWLEAYLFEGKRAPERQLEMEFGGEDDDTGAMAD